MGEVQDKAGVRVEEDGLVGRVVVGLRRVLFFGSR